MPSDSKKKELQRKKDAAKKRQGAKKEDEKEPETNGVAEKVVVNGKQEKVELTAEELLCLKLEEEARLNSEAR